ncbi:hypothetical protein AGOR_G00024340 [Albula goreensis]|uniref:NACHT domain-containing protein n=1 Tax=Albula goreensis TaxID=1534307 RepID=A0A8T3E0W1_9TELE|nr:hypothetical protein AGOR_G00024340 [Albula goreensis]
MCKRNEVQYELKASMKRKYTCIFEGLAKQGSSTVFKKIYTELFITEGGNAGINTQHEVQKIENMVKTQHRRDVVMKCREIFDPEAGHKRFQRNVLMKGMAGIGKSACVQRFILDWAEGERHQDVYFVFPLPFQELNLMEAGQYSLMQLLHSFFPEMRKLEKIECCDDYKILFICDGLDECRLSLDFRRNESWCDVTQPTRLDMLLTNLIRGNLLPSALLWITSRAKASNRIPPDCVHQVVEVRGFNDAQKEEYFRKRLVDENLANRMITHLQSTKALHIMCHIPMFCWTASDILQRAFRGTDGEIPKSLTQMFTHFLLVQLNTKVRKYHRKELNQMLEEEKEFLMKIGKLAFRMLEKDQLILNEEEWKESGISFEEGVVQSGLCTELFKEEFVMYHEKVSCFIHLYIQEYLAALFVLLSFKNSNRNVLDQPLRKLSRIFKEPTLFDLHKSAVDIALQNSSGRFDIFLRFLLGLSVESNQELLRGILTPVGGSGPLEKTAQYIRKKIKENHFPQRRENLTFCLIELEA